MSSSARPTCPGNPVLRVYSPSVTTLLVVLVAVLLRCIMSLHNYSGHAKPPMFGDYEAQRHWMSLTVNLPLEDWYINTTENDLQYWGLDYPPLTAYHSWLCGCVAEYVNSNYTALETSRGYESYLHKFFMRTTVLVADLLVFIPAVLWLLSYKTSTKQDNIAGEGDQLDDLKVDSINLVSIFIILFYPGLVLIDHGHFQYNSVSLGFFVAACAALMRKRELIGSFLFCLALNYKQMELYHALPFFCFLLGSCVPKPNILTFKNGVLKLCKIGLVVVATFIIIWFPFLRSFQLVSQVLHRLFPLARGVFEDKVANVWCSINVVYKLRNVFANDSMAIVCLVTTLVAILPTSIDLIIRPGIKKFHYSLINTSLAFFLFSFQVHEKSILLVAIPVALHFVDDPLPCIWFLFISVFSMLPLLVKDGLLIPTLSLTILYGVTASLIVNFDSMEIKNSNKSYLNQLNIHPPSVVTDCKNDVHNRQGVPKAEPTSLLGDHNLALPTWVLKEPVWGIFYLSIIGSINLTLCLLIFEPPLKYPDLFPLLISVYSCVHFCLFLVYFNYRQYYCSLMKNKVKAS